MDGIRISVRQALGAVSFVGCGDIVVSRAVCDSRDVRRGDMFVAIRGTHHDGHDHLQAAVKNGAGSVLVESPQSRLGIPQSVVRDTRAAWATLSMAFQGYPSERLNVTGVTGTNGKTTTTWLLRSILNSAGVQCGLLGTIEYTDGRSSQVASLTTPGPVELAQLFSRMNQQGSTHCVMEVSSHALDQSRCCGVSLSAAAITNITQDHFDYHGDAVAYRTAKARIASMLPSGKPLLLGIDDDGVRELQKELPSSIQTISFGMTDQSTLKAKILRQSPAGTDLSLRLLDQTLHIRSSLVGRHNVLNCLAAAGLAEQLGVTPDAIVQGLEAVRAVPGRMERIEVGQNFRVFVDYAHTPDGLRHCLQTARALTSGRVICVFGAGGDRDRSKRPLLANAAELADVIVVTSDNPRSESPARIVDEIMVGFTQPNRALRELNRHAAIRNAILMAEPEDTVVIAGRGHEVTQQVAHRQICFDDRKVARNILQDLSRRQPFENSGRDRPHVPLPIPA